MTSPALPPPQRVALAPGGDRRSRIWRKPLSLGATLVLRGLAALILWMLRLIKSSEPRRRDHAFAFSITGLSISP